MEVPDSLKEEVLIGHHVAYVAKSTASWDAADSAGDEARPTAGDAILFAVIVGWDGSQRRQYALLQPIHDGGNAPPLFVVHWDAIAGRSPSRKVAPRMETFMVKQDIVKSLADAQNLRSPSSVNTATYRTRKQLEVSKAAADAADKAVDENHADADESDEDSLGPPIPGEFSVEEPSDAGEGSSSEESTDPSEAEDDVSSAADVDTPDPPARKLFHSTRKAAAAGAVPKHNPKRSLPKPTKPDVEATKVPDNLKGYGFAKLVKAPTPEVTAPLSSLLAFFPSLCSTHLTHSTILIY